jgi:hypothetical protein
MWRIGRVVLVLACFALVGCAGLRPAMKMESIQIVSIEEAMKAASLAARDTDWVVKTMDKENGYLQAEREIRVLGRSGRADVYKLEVDFAKSSDGKVEASAKVTPPPGVMGGQSPDSMVAEFLSAFRSRSK